MADTDTAGALCPPHYWLITQQVGQAAVQLWQCRRCATRKEVLFQEAELSAYQSRYSRGAGRPPQESPASPDAPAVDQQPSS